MEFTLLDADIRDPSLQYTNSYPPFIHASLSRNAINAWKKWCKQDELPADIPHVPANDITIQEAAADAMLQHGSRPFSRLVSANSILNPNQPQSRLFGASGLRRTPVSRINTSSRRGLRLSRPVTRAHSSLSRPPTHQQLVSPISQRGTLLTPGGGISRDYAQSRSLSGLSMRREDTYSFQLRQIKSDMNKQEKRGQLEGCLDCLEKELVLKRNRFGLHSDEATNVIRHAGALCNRLGKNKLEQGNLDDADIFLMKAEILNKNFALQLLITLNLVAAVSRNRYVQTADETELQNALVCLKKSLGVADNIVQKKQITNFVSAKKNSNVSKIEKATASTHLQLCFVFALLREHTLAAAHGQQAIRLLEVGIRKALQRNQSRRSSRKNSRRKFFAPDKIELNVEEQCKELGGAYLALARQHISLKLPGAAVSCLEKGISTLETIGGKHSIIRSLKIQRVKIKLQERHKSDNVEMRKRTHIQQQQLHNIQRYEKLMSAIDDKKDLYIELQPKKTKIDRKIIRHKNDKKGIKRLSVKDINRKAKLKQSIAYGNFIRNQRNKLERRRTNKHRHIVSDGESNDTSNSISNSLTNEGTGYRRITRADMLRAKTGYTVHSINQNDDNTIGTTDVSFDQDVSFDPEEFFIDIEDPPKLHLTQDIGRFEVNKQYNKNVNVQQRKIERRNAQLSKPSFQQGLRSVHNIQRYRKGNTRVGVKMPQWLSKRPAIENDNIDHFEQKSSNIKRSKAAWEIAEELSRSEPLPLFLSKSRLSHQNTSHNIDVLDQKEMNLLNSDQRSKKLKSRFAKRLATNQHNTDDKKGNIIAQKRQRKKKQHSAEVDANRIMLLQHYREMLRLGVPRRAVERDMRSRNISIDMLDTDPTLIFRKAKHLNTHDVREQLHKKRKVVADTRLKAMRRGQLDIGQEHSRKQDINHAAVTIQASVRGWTGRRQKYTGKKIKIQNDAALRIQANVRGWSSRAHTRRKTNARGWTGRRRHEMIARRGISSRDMGMLGARLALHAGDTGRSLSRWTRGRKTDEMLLNFTEEELREIDSAIAIQTIHRGRLGRIKAHKKYVIKNTTPSQIDRLRCVQRAYRNYIARRKARNIDFRLNCTSEMRYAAIEIQKHVRVYAAQKKARKMRIEKGQNKKWEDKYSSLNLEKRNRYRKDKVLELHPPFPNQDGHDIVNLENGAKEINGDIEVMDIVKNEMSESSTRKISELQQQSINAAFRHKMNINMSLIRALGLRMPNVKENNEVRGVYAVVKVIPVYLQHNSHVLEVDRAKLVHRTETRFWKPGVLEEKMAIIIQAYYRSFRIRFALRKPKEPIDKAKFATNIQAVWRGRCTRNIENLGIRGINIYCGSGAIGAIIRPGTFLFKEDRGAMLLGFYRSKSGNILPIEADGRIRKGMYLVSINGKSTVEKTFNHISKMIRVAEVKQENIFTFQIVPREIYDARVLKLMTSAKKKIQRWSRTMLSDMRIRVVQEMSALSIQRSFKSMCNKRKIKANAEQKRLEHSSAKSIQNGFRQMCIRKEANRVFEMFRLTIVSVTELPLRRHNVDKRQISVAAALGEHGQSFALKKRLSNTRRIAESKESFKGSFETIGIQKAASVYWCATCELVKENVKVPEISLQIIETSPNGIRRPIGECALRLLKEHSGGTETYAVCRHGTKEVVKGRITVSWQRFTMTKKTLSVINTTRFFTAVVPGGRLGCNFQSSLGGIGVAVKALALVDGTPGPLASVGVKVGMHLIDMKHPNYKSDNEKTLGNMNFLDAIEILRLHTSEKKELIFSNNASTAALEWSSRQAFLSSIDPKGYAIFKIQRCARVFLAKLREQDTLLIPQPNIASIYAHINILKNRMKQNEANLSNSEKYLRGSGGEARILERAHRVLRKWQLLLRLLVKEEDSFGDKTKLITIRRRIYNLKHTTAIDSAWTCRQLQIKKYMKKYEKSRISLLQVKAQIDSAIERETPEILKKHLGEDLRISISRIEGINDFRQRCQNSGRKVPQNLEIPSLYLQLLVGEQGYRWQSKLDCIPNTSDKKLSSRYITTKSVIERGKFAVWNEHKMITLTGIKSPEMTIRLMERVIEEQDILLGECSVIIPSSRTSNGIQRYTFKAPINSKNFSGGSILLQWQRAMSVQLSGEKLYKFPKLKDITIEVNPGSMSAKFLPGPGGIGLRVASFFLDARGKHGQLERSNIKLGMYLSKLDDNANVATMYATDILVLLKSKTNTKKHMVWSSRPSEKALKIATINAMSRNIKQRAVMRIQKYIREWKLRKLVDVESKIKDEKYMSVGTKHGDILNINVIGCFGLPAANDFCTLGKYTRIALCVGEKGLRWENKVKNTGDCVLECVCQTPFRKSKETLAYNYTSAFCIGSIDMPELSVRIIQSNNGANNTKETSDYVLAEAFSDIPNELDSREQCLLKSLSGSVELLWSYGVGAPFYNNSGEFNMRQYISTSLDFRSFAKSQIAVSVKSVESMGIRLGAEDNRIAQFRGVNGKPGICEIAGMCRGMQLVRINGKPFEGKLRDEHWSSLQNDIVPNNLYHLVTFSLNNFERPIYFFNKTHENSARVIQRLFLTQKHSKCKGTDPKYLENVLHLSLSGAVGVKFCNEIQNDSRNRFSLCALTGERGRSWEVKQKLNQGRSKGLLHRSCKTKLRKLSNWIRWEEYHKLNLQGYIDPEVTVRLCMQSPNNKVSSVIGEAKLSVAHRSSRGSKRYCLNAGQGGGVFMKWHRDITGVLHPIDPVNLPELIVKNVHVKSDSSLRVSFQPYFGKFGLRVSSFETGDDGGIGILEEAGVHIGMIVTKIDDKPLIGSLRFEEAKSLLKKLFTSDCVVTFSTHPPSNIISLLNISVKHNFNDIENSAAVMIQRLSKKIHLQKLKKNKCVKNETQKRIITRSKLEGHTEERVPRVDQDMLRSKRIASNNIKKESPKNLIKSYPSKSKKNILEKGKVKHTTQAKRGIKNDKRKQSSISPRKKKKGNVKPLALPKKQKQNSDIVSKQKPQVENIPSKISLMPKTSEIPEKTVRGNKSTIVKLENVEEKTHNEHQQSRFQKAEVRNKPSSLSEENINEINSISISPQPIKLEVKQKRKKIKDDVTIRVPGGPLGMGLCPGANNCSLFISRFLSPLSDGNPGVVELHPKIRPGMILKKINDVNTKDIDFNEGLKLLKTLASESKVLVFSRATNKQMLMISLEAMQSNQTRAAIRIQNIFRSRRTKNTRSYSPSATEINMERNLKLVKVDVKRLRGQVQKDEREVSEARAMMEHWNKKANDEEMKEFESKSDDDFLEVENFERGNKQNVCVEHDIIKSADEVRGFQGNKEQNVKTVVIEGLKKKLETKEDVVSSKHTISIDVPPGPLYAQFGGHQTLQGIFVKSFRPDIHGGSPLSKGGIVQGMRLVFVGDTDVSSLSKKMAMSILKKSAQAPKTLIFEKILRTKLKASLVKINNSIDRHSNSSESTEIQDFSQMNLVNRLKGGGDKIYHEDNTEDSYSSTMMKKGLGGIQGRRKFRAATKIQCLFRVVLARKNFAAMKLLVKQTKAASKLQHYFRYRRKCLAVTRLQCMYRKILCSQQFNRKISISRAAQAAYEAATFIHEYMVRSEEVFKLLVSRINSTKLQFQRHVAQQASMQAKSAANAALRDIINISQIIQVTAVETIQRYFRGARVRFQMKHQWKSGDKTIEVKIPGLIRNWRNSFHPGLNDTGAFVSHFSLQGTPLLYSLGVNIGMFVRSIDGENVTELAFSKLKTILKSKERNGQIKTMVFSTNKIFRSRRVEEIRGIPRVSTAVRNSKRTGSAWIKDMFTFDDLESVNEQEIHELKQSQMPSYNLHSNTTQYIDTTNRRPRTVNDRTGKLYPSWKDSSGICNLELATDTKSGNGRFSKEAILIEIYADDDGSSIGSAVKNRGSSAEISHTLVGFAVYRPCDRMMSSPGPLKSGEKRNVTLWLAGPDAHKNGIYNSTTAQNFGQVNFEIYLEPKNRDIQDLKKTYKIENRKHKSMMSFEGKLLPFS